MGIGTVLSLRAGRSSPWTPEEPGDYLVLAPPPEGTAAAAWKLRVAPASSPSPGPRPAGE